MMPDGNTDPNERKVERPHRTMIRISSIDEHSTISKTIHERPSVFSWRDDSCWSVSENTKSRDFRRKRFKKQKGEYLATKDPPPEVLKEIMNANEENDHHTIDDGGHGSSSESAVNGSKR
ncbi:Toxin-antitoxin system antitoxin component PHD domain protein [Paragonimus skrjabini miyazakii]|uniref:Toxin-antitoxin system antitoxin component PHD domain protein n=1 Tax=Paragonimus skrjabini miyazakii TaxID=59628 RepID=A0A8S9YDN2_9TREM|nr:Toxin-antitoxin system antitoxin component PHD domain protein [Paragonimus skrjabini miyazakii]